MSVRADWLPREEAPPQRGDRHCDPSQIISGKALGGHCGSALTSHKFHARNHTEDIVLTALWCAQAVESHVRELADKLGSRLAVVEETCQVCGCL